MSKMQFDPLDAALTIAVAASGFMMVGIATFSLFDVDFAAVALSIAGQDLSTAYIIGALALLATVATNDNTDFSQLGDDVEKLDDYYMGAVAATFGLMIAWVFIPDVASFFQSQDLWGLVYVGVTTTGQFAVGWML